MTGRTNRYGLSTLGQGDSLSADGYKFTSTDRETLDYLLARGAEVHHHDGLTVGLQGPVSALNLALRSTGGALPPGTRIYYKYTYVQDGQESVAGPEAWIDTPAAVATPGPPVVTSAITGGTLMPGTYYYVVSAYKSSNTLETVGSDPNFAHLTGATGTNLVTLTMPTLPAGATGFNVYVRKPGQSKYFYIASTTSGTYTHDGSAAQDCDRSVPSRNATNSSNSVLVSMPGATPAVPAGCTWKLYRTYSPGQYSRSLLFHVVEAVTEGGGVVTPVATDIGVPTTVGAPPTTILTVTNPTKIDLATETQGSLPVARVSDIPVLLTLNLPGALQAGQSVAWVNNYTSQPHVLVQRIDLTLPPGSSPAGQQVVIDVYRGDDTVVPTYSDLFVLDPGARPAIDVGNERSYPALDELGFTIGIGEVLSFRVAQDGGGATPSDHDLSISVWLAVNPLA